MSISSSSSSRSKGKSCNFWIWLSEYGRKRKFILFNACSRRCFNYLLAMCYLARRREKSIRQLLDIHAFFNLYLCMLNNLPFYMFMSMSRKCLSLKLSEFFQLKQFDLLKLMLKSSDKYFYKKTNIYFFSIHIKLFICITFCRYKLLHSTLPFGFTFLFINALS